MVVAACRSYPIKLNFQHAGNAFLCLWVFLISEDLCLRSTYILVLGNSNIHMFNWQRMVPFFFFFWKHLLPFGKINFMIVFKFWWKVPKYITICLVICRMALRVDAILSLKGTHFSFACIIV